MSKKMQNVEDVYSLSPLQEGMLFHTMCAPDSGVYVNQMTWTFEGNLDTNAFRRAWETVVERHAVLRTMFVFEKLDRPLQIVRKHVELPWEELDRRRLPADESDAQFQAFLKADARRGFEPARAPLSRWTLFRTGDARFRFVWSYHHALIDGWSLSLVVKEVFELYDTFRKGSDPALPGPRPFRDYIAHLRKQDRGKAEAYWRSLLEDFETPSLFADLFGRAGSSEPSFGDLRIEFTADQAARLSAFARASHVTLNTVLQGAWAILLGRYARSRDVVFGTTVSGRPANLPGVESMVGLFINTLPIRAKLDSERSVQAFLSELQQQQADSQTFDHTPLSDIAARSALDAGTPLFDHVFVFENFPVDKGSMNRTDGLSIVDFQAVEQSNFPLAILAGAGETLWTQFIYDRGRFTPDAVERLAGHFKTLLDGMAASPNSTLAELPMLTEAELQRELVEWNDTAAPFPEDLSIHHPFEAQVEKTPDATALEWNETSISYRELDRRADDLANLLIENGVAPGAIVGINLERSPEMVIAVIAAFKAGAAYLPLDPNYPAERIDFMIEDANPTCVVTSSKNRVRGSGEEKGSGFEVQGSGKPSEDFESFGKLNISVMRTSSDSETPNPEPRTLNPAYVIYTSGSTGKPKGTVLGHRGLCNLAAAQTSVFGSQSGKRVLQFASLNFDASIFEIVLALTSGGTLCLASRDAVLPGPPLAETLRGKRITTAVLPPTALSALGEPDYPDLETLIVAGEACPPDLARRWSRGRRFFNAYGPTETTVWATVADWSDGECSTGIGRPIQNTKAVVLDSDSRPVPVGVPGELCLGGVGLALGYLNRPELTAEKFIPNPFFTTKDTKEVSTACGSERVSSKTSSLIPHPSSLLYRTGDLVRRLTDGNLEFLGRFDHQVKLRGFRIELGEIEAALRRHPNVSDATVIVREDVPGLKRLVAYLVPKSVPSAVAGGFTAKDAREVSTVRGSGWVSSENSSFIIHHSSFLRRFLPEHMIPSAFMVLDALPLTPNGKIDRRALPAPETEKAAPTTPEDLPQTPVEHILLEVWRAVLKNPRLGVHDNFFEAGGDSIVGIQAVFKAKQQGVVFTPAQLFENQTVAALAGVAVRLDHVETEETYATGDIPLTPIQHWFFDQNTPDPHWFNHSILLTVPADLDSRAMRKSVKAVLAHHDALRTRFALDGHFWKQFVSAPDDAVPFERLDVGGLPASERSAFVETEAARLQTLFDLSAGPLVRIAWFDFGPASPGRLLLVIHHLVVDGVSWRVVLEDLQTGYEQARRGDAVVLPPRTTSFKHWSERLTTLAGDEAALDFEIKYWTQPLDELRAVPVDFNRAAPTLDSSEHVSRSLSEPETHRLLHDVSAAHRTRTDEVLLAAMTRTLGEWADRDALSVALESHGREELFDDLDVTRTVGWFTALYPVRLPFDRYESPGETLGSVKETLRAIPNRGVGHGLLKHLHPKSEIREAVPAIDMPDVTFNYLGQFDQVLDAGGLFAPADESTGATRSPRATLTAFFEINAWIAEGRLTIDWTYSRNLYRPETVTALADSFIGHLNDIITHCLDSEAAEFTPSDFPLAQLDSDELAAAFAEYEGVFAESE